MGPEQAEGRHEAVTTASDVYGLGGILYALLTGRAPFRGDSVLTTLEQVKNQPPEPPRKSNPAVAKDLELICLKCLSKEAHRRYASAEALANELERYLDGKPLLLTRPVGNAERTLRWCLRNPAVAALTTGIALALVIVATVSTVAYFQLRAANEQERASRERAEKNLAVARDAVAYFAKVTEDPQMQKRGLEKLREQMRTRAKDFYVQLTAHQPDDPRLAADQGRAFVALGRMEFLLGSPRQAIGAHRQAQAIFERLVQQHPGIEEFEEGLARSLLEQGALFQITQQMVEARQVLSRAVEIQERLFNWQPSKLAYQQGLARAYFELGRLHQVNRQPEKARAVYEEALMRFKPVAESHPEAEYQAPLARTHINLGTVYALPALAQLPEAPANGVQAARHYAAAQDILEKLDKENAECQCLLAEAHHLIGRMLRDSDRPRDMNVHFESALAILGGLTHKYTDVPDYQFRLGAMYHAQGFAFVLLKQLDRAASSYEKAAAATEALVREYDLPDYQRELGALCYDRACLAGLSAAALKDSPLAPAEREQKLDQLTQEACEQLGKSWDSGFLQSERIFAHFKGDTDLNPLRGRDDFEKLVVEFEKQQRAKSPPAPR